MSSRAASLEMADSARLRAQFAGLLERHGPGLRRVARVYASRTSETEDLWQEIAFALWRALPSFRRESSERTFAFRVAHNRGLSFAARARRPERASDPNEPEPDAPSDAPSPEERLGEQRRRDALWRGILKLAPGARAVITLALEGLSHDEIAEVLGITTNAVGVRLSRARDQLKQILGGSDEA
jgi:RNA polymerase sigma-70 factor (ECF subfamily)